MGRFLEQTIQSVLSQDHISLEYIVMDGGSDDGTVAILERYAGRLRYESQPDGGAPDAINRGFESATGDIFGYLNADDVYLPGTVAAVVRAFEDNPDAYVVYGDARWIDEQGAPLGRYPTCDFDVEDLASECFICQPAAFVRRTAFESVGGMDPARQYTFDYDLWLRLARRHRFYHLPRELAQSRMHRDNKTLGARRRVLRETIDTVRANTGYAPFGHVYAYACYLIDGRDQFYEPLQPSWWKYALTLPLGLRFNGLTPGRFLRGYAGF